MTKKETEMEKERRHFAGIINQTYCKRPLWDRFKDAVGVFFMACTILLCLAVIIFLVVMLIENPVSLGILCLTIFLILAWSSR